MWLCNHAYARSMCVGKSQSDSAVPIAQGQAILSESDDYDEISPGQSVTIARCAPTETRAAIQDLPGGVVESFSSELGLYKISFPAIGQSFQAPPSRVVVALVGRKRTAPERFFDYRQEKKPKSKLRLKKMKKK